MNLFNAVYHLLMYVPKRVLVKEKVSRTMTEDGTAFIFTDMIDNGR